MRSIPLVLLAWLGWTAAAVAQREPHVGYVYPAGGRQGATLETTLGGHGFEGATRVFVSGTGVRATVLRHDRQVTPQEQKQLVEALDRLRTKRQQNKGLSEAEEKQAAEMRRKLDGFGRRLTNPALNEFITLRVAIAPDAKPGPREIRLDTPVGLSNPLPFHVGQLPEFSKKDWKNIPQSRDNQDPERSPVPNVMRVAFPITLNGQVQPGGVDHYRFAAKAGQPLFIKICARELIPYIADAVPGWLQTMTRLLGPDGQPLKAFQDPLVHLDPESYYTIPADGEYVLEIRDALYRGREDFVYRATLVEQAAPERPFPLRPAAVEPWPEILADSSGTQAVTLPVVIAGRISHPRETKVFQFEGRAGQPLVAEVQARRLGSPLDSKLRLTDAVDKQLAFNDDFEDRGAALNTHQADSYFVTTLPAAGSYFLQIGDTQGQGSPAHAYRLRLGAPQPDFDLRVAPSSINVRAGASVPVTAYALRKDGFNGPIVLALKNAPKGLLLTGAEIPAGHDRITFTLTAVLLGAGQPLNLQLEGRADIGNGAVAHPAVPAEDVMQAFAYRHLVPAQEMKVSVWGRSTPPRPARILTATPLRLRGGETVRIEAAMAIQPMMGKIQFELHDAPGGVTLQDASVKEDRAELLLELDETKLKPGLKGNLIILAFAERSPQSSRQEPAENPRRVPLGCLPAIPFEVAER